MNIPLLYENQDLIIADKPAGLATIPEREGGKTNLISILKGQIKGPLYVVHRLDKDVSGAIIFARTEMMHKYLNGLFEEREVQKTYMALVFGVFLEKTGRIDKSIRQFGSGRMGVDLKMGKPCTTYYKVKESRGGFSLLEVQPVTGRRHQIRVHLYSVHHPIVGDSLYGDPALQNKFPRLMLHAREIELPLPSGESLKINSPLPPSFKDVLNSLPA